MNFFIQILKEAEMDDSEPQLQFYVTFRIASINIVMCSQVKFMKYTQKKLEYVRNLIMGKFN